MKNNVLFVSTESITGLPFLHQYETCFDGCYDLLFWDRSGIRSGFPRANLIPFEHVATGYAEKIKGYLGFKRFAERHIRNSSYEKVILLYTQSAVLLGNVLLERYKGHYICDIRDYSFEGFSPYRFFEGRVLRGSALNVISSEGYKSFLPKGIEYHIMHNNHINTATMRVRRNGNNPIVIGNIGGIRFHDQCRRFIKCFSEDDRYRLLFCGNRAQELKQSCREMDLSHVEFVDRFPPEDVEKYLLQCDLLFNLYGNHTPLLDYALSNRLYYCAEYGIPILTCPDTFMHQIEEKYHLGFCVDLNNRLSSEILYREYNSFDFELFDKGRSEFLERCVQDNETTLGKISAFLSSI